MNKVNKYLIDTFEKIFASNKILVASKGKKGLFVQYCKRPTTNVFSDNDSLEHWRIFFSLVMVISSTF